MLSYFTNLVIGSNAQPTGSNAQSIESNIQPFYICVVDMLEPMANLLNQATDLNSNFYRFIDENQQYVNLLNNFTTDLKKMLVSGFRNKDGKFVNLMGEYLNSIEALAQGNKTPLIELFSEPKAQRIVKIFNRYSRDLAAINVDFLNFEESLKPSPTLDDSFDEIEDFEIIPQDMIERFDQKVTFLNDFNIIDDYRPNVQKSNELERSNIFAPSRDIAFGKNGQPLTENELNDLTKSRRYMY